MRAYPNQKQKIKKHFYQATTPLKLSPTLDSGIIKHYNTTFIL